MWDAVRKIFRQDDTPEESNVAANAAGADAGTGAMGTPPAQQGPPSRSAMSPLAGGTVEPGEAEASPRVRMPAAEGGTSMEQPMTDAGHISPPGHDPQGLAADASMPPAAPAERVERADSPAADAGAEPATAQTQDNHGGTDVVAEQGTTALAVETEAQPPANPNVAAMASDEEAMTAPATDATESSAPNIAPHTTPVEATEPEATIEDVPGSATTLATPPTPPTTLTGSIDGGPSDAESGGAEVSHAADGAEMGVQPQQTSGVSDEAASLAASAATPAPPEGSALPGENIPTLDEGAPGEREAAAVQATPETAEAEPAREPGVETPAALAPGAVVGDRYTIDELVDASGEGDTRAYRAVDRRSYERCWSCGSEGNEPGTRFCQQCGAPIQNHQVVLVQTAAATGAPGEVEQDGLYFHVQPERRRFGAEGIGVEIGAHSAEGPHHPNEDSYWYTARTLCANSGRQSIAVAIFADGMGGYAPGSGLISARIAATAGASIVAALDARGGASLEEGEAERIVREGIAEANRMVLEEIARSGEMGSTLVAAVIVGDTAYVANVGDSRAYFVDPRGQATQITRDQSLVAQELSRGTLAAEDIYNAPGNNIILHAIGEENVAEAADWYAQPLEPDSLIVLCSDGYWKTMRGTLISESVLQQGDTLNDVARRMVDDALAQGSDDNTTVLLIAVS